MTKLKFFEKLDLIDGLMHAVDKANCIDIFKEISTHLDNSSICQYFFEQIEDEIWLETILTSDFMEEYRSGEIPELVNNQFDWFFMGYLLKVAERTPELTSSYIKSVIPMEDERLHQRMIEVMLKLPCDYSSELAIDEIEWCRSKDDLFGLYPEFACKLILHIQECNEKVAFDFIREILKVDAVTIESGTPGSDSHYKRTDIKARYSDWEYQSVLDKYVLKFVLRSNNYLQYIGYLFDHLSNVLSLEKYDPLNDYSWVWRNTLEDNEQTRHISGIKEYLLVFLRDISINLIKDEKDRFHNIVQELNKYEWTIFKRLSIYMSVKFPDINIDLTEKLISNTNLYESSSTRNEYSLLLDSAFNLVSKDVQSTVYTWIEDGVDLEHYIIRYKEREGIPPSEEEIDHYKDYWKKTRLYLIRNHLEGEKLAEYETLIQEKGEPDHPEYSSYTTSWVGPTSPMSVDEINQLDIKALVVKLKEWKASGKSMGPSPEGLSRNLSDAIKADIDRYKHSASLFKGLPPTYVRGVFQGFRDNFSSLDADSWLGIIELSEWVLSQESDIEGEQDIDSDEDPGWSWCKQSISSLLDSGLKKSKSEIPIYLKDKIWPLINTLTQDSDPTPEYETEYGGSNMEPTTMSINTVRGSAFHALVNYGLWVARNTKTQDKKISFDDIPEMRQVLDDHLYPDNDPSSAIRSVYGQFYPWLNLLDNNWAIEARTRIFSDDDLGLGDAAWDAYITFCQPYDDTFKVIPDMYLKYAKRLSDINEINDRDRTLEHFAGHIITFYWRSKIDLDDEVTQAFYTHAPLNLRKHAIEFIGRSLRNTSDGLEENIEQRLKALYEWRQAEANKSGEYEELEEFCWWIDADILDREWVLTKFHELLKVLEKLDSLDFAARKLGSYLEINPSMVLECMDMMIDKLKTPGMYFSWDDAAQDILRKALLLDGVKHQAIELVHKIGSRGFLNYRDLLITQ
ncbi:MAG: hypothetical protein N0E58_15790 [Candidatus Thiodiazotropha endolucinida]|uniref:Uncharacterized protein n=1 Tax=Candidatus Thiodiazotropha taylori TaxID=2792791 RepID=A0A9E4NLF6_9GAMM|nr:hypothetical protein [Candidatus Thiodiazotropha taylori]MCW4237709.1 hypothetical protein [Candidatus Thiodiazotropha endolucinida]